MRNHVRRSRLRPMWNSALTARSIQSVRRGRLRTRSGCVEVMKRIDPSLTSVVIQFLIEKPVSPGGGSGRKRKTFALAMKVVRIDSAILAAAGDIIGPAIVPFSL